jgi:cell division protein FtsB
VEVGVPRNVTIVLKNEGDGDASNISITLTGLDPSWFRLIPSRIGTLKPNETASVFLEITVPAGTQPGNFMLKIKAEAKDTSDQKPIKLTVFTSRKDLVEFELARLKAKTDELEFNTNRIKDTYDVDDVLKLIPQIRSKISEAEGYLADNKIDAALGSIYAGWDLYNKAAALLEAAKPRVAPEIIPMWLLLVILLMIGLVLFLVVVLRKLSLNMKVLLRGRYSEARTVTGIVKKEPEVDALRTERDKLQRMIALLESQYKQGIISKEAFDGLRTSSEAKLKALDEQIRKELKV